jgi:hypothetical protein
MSFPQILAVAVGLILVYYVLGAIVSIITQMVMESFETRGTALEMYLKRIAGDKYVELTGLPQIKALRPIRYANWWNVFGAGTEEKKLEKIPAETLVEAFFDVSGLSGRGSLNADELTSLIGKLPDSDGKRALLGWVQQGVTAISDLRERTHDYFGGMLGQAAMTFKAKARSSVIISSIVITLLFGTDSIQLAKDLWTDAGLRNLAASQAELATSPTSSRTDLDALIARLGVLSFRTGWWRTPTAGLPTSPLDWLASIALKLTGLGITAVAVSQGSSFWYDLLKKFAGSSGSPAPASVDDGGAVG